jgi:DNA polymerase-3 subunit alpha
VRSLEYNEYHCHTHFSVGDCIIKTSDLVKRSLELRRKTVTITDHGTLGGIYELFKECKDKDIRPVAGLEAYYVDDIEAQASSIPYNYAHTVLIAKNNVGWMNMKLLQGLSWEKGYFKKPRIDKKMLEMHREGLICSTACVGGLIGWSHLEGMDKFHTDKKVKKKILKERMQFFKDLFGDDFYFEISLNDLDIQRKLNKYIINLCRKFNGKLLITCDAHYIYRKDYHEHDITKCYSRKKTLAESENGTYPTHEVYLKDGLQNYHSWQAFHDDYMSEEDFYNGLRSSVEIAEKIEKIDLTPKDRTCLPEFCDNPHEEFNKLIELGWHRKLTEGQKSSNIYKERLISEKQVIGKLKMESYMLVCADIIRRAKEMKIPVGPGRGSVCGSLVAFLIDITQIDPIRFNIIFERFLTEDRLSLPDIDMDFGREGREKVKEAVKKLYGEEKFAAIITYQDWKPRNLIKDIGKVLGRDFQSMNDITKKIHDKTKKFNDDEYPPTPEVLTWLGQNPDIYGPARKLEGVYRAKGVHASGMILTPTKLEDWVPTAFMTESYSDEKKPAKVSEWDMYGLEDLNILKIDFLGLQTLDVIEGAVDLINRNEVKINNIWDTCLGDLENEEVYKTICEGKIIGMFQLESSEGMAELVKKLKPVCFHDIVMLISLYRTAILKAGMADEYVNRRNGRDFEYMHPIIEPVLKDTLGCLVFQEQLMEIGVVAAGMTRSESDNFRKATKLKDLEKFKSWENRFVEGCMKNGVVESTARELWMWCIKWAGYGFNISHASAYALITYTTGWLKTFYPREYMASLMSFNAGDKDMMPKYIDECKKLKIKIGKPSINKSDVNFVLGKEKIIQPFSIIANVGEKVITELLKERAKGKFESFEDFMNRVDLRVCNVRVLTNLILSETFNTVEEKTIEEIYGTFIDGRKERKIFRQYYCPDCKFRYPCTVKSEEIEITVCNNCGSGDISFDFESKESKKSLFNKVFIQNQVYGFAIMDNPLKRYVNVISHYDAEYLTALNDYEEGVMVAVAAYVKNIKRWKDKKGNEMAFIDLSDGEFDCSMTVFSGGWESLQNDINKNCCYIFVAKKNRGNNLMWVDRGQIKSKIVKLGL